VPKRLVRGLVYGLVASVAIHAAAAGAECQMAVVSQLNLTHAAPGFLVTVMLNDKPVQLLFDTGSFTSILNMSTVVRVGLPSMRGEGVDGLLSTVSGIGGGRSAMAVTAHTVDIGGLKGRDYNFIAADIIKPPAEGLLSIDLISQFDVDLDVPENKFVLYRPNGDCSAPAAFLAGPLSSTPLRPHGTDRRPRINVSIDGQTLVAMIDTGATHTAIFRRAAERLGIDSAALEAAPHQTVTGVGPRSVTAITQMLKPITIGGLTFEKMPVAVLDEHTGDDVDMLLGADFQRLVHLWISYSSGTLVMQYPPRASKHAE
jgi:clan AA aspartic protease (TIGR02281 family)